VGVAVNSRPIEISQRETCNSLEERAFVAENGPEAAGLVDQIAGAISAVRAGG
jgi:hypothetical protein